jgi:hypothetical protein
MGVTMQTKSWCVAVTCVLAAAPLSAAAQSVVGETQILATLAGRFATPSPGQENIRFYGTDLGWSFEHQGQLWILFGDTYPDWLGGSLEPTADDALAKISLADFPNGDAVDRFIAAHPAPSGQPGWRAAAPPLDVTRNRSGHAAPVRVTYDGAVLNTGIGFTPIAGFSNARSDDSGAAFQLFYRNVPVQCDAAHSCQDGLECDTGVGQCRNSYPLATLCVVGVSACDCVPYANGLCQDRSSSVYDANAERGRMQSVVIEQAVGNTLHEDDTRVASQPWTTNRFANATVRAVNSLTDYTAADGVGSEDKGVFIWGRPGFGGIGGQDRDAQLYLAWVPMPSYDATGHFAWQPRYFAGLDDAGQPEFAAREVDAQPLDLDAATSGDQPHEPLDIVNQMAISWVPALQRWVMLYAGDLDGDFLPPLFGSDVALAQHDAYGAVQLRTAEHPWGPWTTPERVLLASDGTPGPVGQYAPGGILHHPDCNQRDCIPGDGIVTQNDRGFYYGVNIVDTWTSERASSVDLYWFVSTWNPYQVMLVKTALPR